MSRMEEFGKKDEVKEKRGQILGSVLGVVFIVFLAFITYYIIFIGDSGNNKVEVNQKVYELVANDLKVSENDIIIQKTDGVVSEEGSELFSVTSMGGEYLVQVDKDHREIEKLTRK